MFNNGVTTHMTKKILIIIAEAIAFTAFMATLGAVYVIVGGLTI